LLFQNHSLGKKKKKAHETLNSDENINQSRLAGDGYKTDFENTN
jgi:hypothetical protein